MTLLSPVASGAKAYLLKNVHIIAPDDWLQACVDWIHDEQQQEATPSQSQVNEQVYEQWLVSDLRDIEAKCLPDNSISTQKTYLNGFYCLQVDSVLNVGSSFYSQLQRVTGTENANAAVDTDDQPRNFWEPKPTRMLMLSLTDGNQDIKGMEYKPIPQLSEDLQPGTKLLISGNILCRLGVLMLTANNIRVLGGEVDTLVEQNMQQLLLARVLNVDINKIRPTEHCMYKDPRRIPGSSGSVRGSACERDTGRLTATQSSVPSQQRQHQQLQNRQQQQQHPVALRNSNNENHNNYISSNDSTRNYLPNQESPALQSTEFETMDEDDFLDQMDVEELEAFEQWDEEEDNMLASIPLDVEQDSRQNSAEKEKDSNSHQSYTRNTGLNNGKAVSRRLNISSAVTGRSSAHTFQDSGFDSTLGQSTIMNGTNQSSRTFSSHESVATHSNTSNFDADRNVSNIISSDANPEGHRNPQNSVITKEHYNEMETEYGISKNEPIIDLTDEFDDDDDFEDAASVSFSEMQSGLDHEKEAKRPRLELPTNVVDLDTPPYTYLSKILAHIQQVDHKIVKVKAFISTLLGKLDHNSETKWTLRAKINDGTAAVDVDLGDEFLASLIGFPATEVKVMKANKKDKSVKEKMMKGIKSCQLALIEMSGIMDLEISMNMARPKVLDFHEMTSEDICSLKARTKMH